MSQGEQERAELYRFVASRLNRRRLFQTGAGLAAGAALGGGLRRGALARPAFRDFNPRAVAAANAVLQQTGDSADAAVAAAQQYKGTTLNVIWEEGLQAEDPTKFSGPMWEQATGIKINVITKPFTDLFSAQVTEHLAGTGGIDVLSFPPAWQADFVGQGLTELLDPFIDKYMNKADLEDYHPLFKSLMQYKSQYHGLFDDGDIIILYYRTDLFNDQANKDAFKKQFGYNPAAPKDWKQYDDIQGFFTEKFKPKLYGGASQRAPGQVYGWFTEEFRNRGGKFFNADTMDATLDSQAGVDTVTRMVASNKTMPPGVETWGFVEVLTAWMNGTIAMIGGTWPPIGRWSEGHDAEQLKWVPATKVAGKVGYSIMPMGHGLHNAGYMLGVSADSKVKEAAYLYIQWMTSPKISLQRVMLPYSLRDPYRLTHYSSPEYRSRWVYAGVYLDTLKAAADVALIDLIIPGSAEYNTAMDQAVTAAQSGTDPAKALKDANAKFNEITDRVGRDKQKAAYADFLKLKGSYYT